MEETPRAPGPPEPPLTLYGGPPPKPPGPPPEEPPTPPGGPPPEPPGPPPPAEPSPAGYPVEFSVDYPDRDLNRLTTFFRIFTVIPITLLYIALTWTANFISLALVLLILFRKKYPRWWFDWNRELLRFTNRLDVYFFLLDDRYPSTDEHQSVHLDFPYPDAERDLMRGMPLIKWLLAIPHYIVLLLLGIGAFFVIIVAWFAILFTGRYPRWAFDYVVGVMRWSNRVMGYAFILVTDRYPPFRLRP